MKKRLSSSPYPPPINQQLTRREDPGGNGESELSAQLQIKAWAWVSQQTQPLALKTQTILSKEEQKRCLEQHLK